MKISLRVLMFTSALFLAGCMTVYKYQATQRLTVSSKAVEVTGDFDKENYFFNTVVANKTEQDLFLNLEKSYTMINGEAVGLTRFSSIKSLDGSGKTSPILIPPSAKASVEISNVKQTDGVHYDTWFPGMWEKGNLTGLEIKLVLTFERAKGESFKESVETRLGEVATRTY